MRHLIDLLEVIADCPLWVDSGHHNCSLSISASNDCFAPESGHLTVQAMFLARGRTVKIFVAKNCVKSVAICTYEVLGIAESQEAVIDRTLGILSRRFFAGR